MTAPTTTLNAYAERLVDAPILGHLCWYMVPNAVLIDHDEARRLMIEAGLCIIDTDGDGNTTTEVPFLSRPPRDHDVFRRVCTQRQRTRVVSEETGVYLNILVRDVKREGQQVWKQVVVEKVDADDKRLAYVPSIGLHYDGSNMHLTALDDDQLLKADDELQALGVAKEIETEFEAQRGKLNGHSLRITLSEILAANSAILAKPGGGLYFVPQASATICGLLTRFTEAVGQGIVFHYVPLVDDRSQREMLRRAFEDESVGEITRLQAEMAEALDGGKITQKRLAEFAERREALANRIGEYKTLLSTGLDTAGSAMDIASRQFAKLISHTKTGS